MLNSIGASWSGDQVVGVLGSNPPATKLLRFGTLAIPFTPICHWCLSEETLKFVKAIGPFYNLVSIPEQVKYPKQGVNV